MALSNKKIPRIMIINFISPIVMINRSIIVGEGSKIKIELSSDNYNYLESNAILVGDSNSNNAFEHNDSVTFSI